MSTKLTDLEPKIVWSIFNEILKVSRPSKHEERIREWLCNFANEHKLAFEQDQKGNVVIIKPATKGFENHDAIVLQSHMDMVCEKDSNVKHDFLKDPISAYVEDGWVKASGTTLGADCGIGMALQLAVLVDNTLQNPKIEALFTVNEEQGLSGAKNLSNSILTGKYLINLDSEDEGEIFIGCAGGVDTLATFETPLENIPSDHSLYKITVSGLLGGHSGDDIHRGRACANKLLTRFLMSLCVENNALLCEIDGGNLRNAIARDAHAIIAVPNNDKNILQQIFDDIYNGIKNEFDPVEPNMVVTIANVDENTQCIVPTYAHKLIEALQTIPHGVIAMSNTMQNLVETSTNLASVKQNQQQTIVTTSQRSSIESAKNDIKTTVAIIMKMAGANVEYSDKYPGWEPNPTSILVKKSVEIYKEIFFKSPSVKAIHAGLECGLILEKYPQMQAISIGPTLRGVHSPSEKLDISTVSSLWIYLTNLVKKI